MMTFEEARLQLRLGSVELTNWIRRAWVKPLRQGDDWIFDECDIARLQLIHNLRELDINDEAVPVVLSLLDQLYATRTALSRYRDLLETLPDPTLQAVVEALQAERRN